MSHSTQSGIIELLSCVLCLVRVKAEARHREARADQAHTRLASRHCWFCACRAWADDLISLSLFLTCTTGRVKFALEKGPQESVTREQAIAPLLLLVTGTSDVNLQTLAFLLGTLES